MNSPRKISALEWDQQMHAVPDAFKDECRHLRNVVDGGVPYLASPYEYACRGDNLLMRLKYDNSSASLRLWSLIFSEKNRLFLAKSHGHKIIAAMKDLGTVPILAYAAPNALAFYADELWWAPCFAEEPHLLEQAARLGAGDELCYVRAALGAMLTLDYFPEPDLCIAGVGACCDDFSAVMQLIEEQGFPTHWWELPSRLDCSSSIVSEQFGITRNGKSRYQKSALDFIVCQLRGVLRSIEELTGLTITESMLERSRDGFNQIRKRVALLRNLVYRANKPPLPGLEMMLAEFLAIHACSDIEESINVLDGLIETVNERLRLGISPFGDNPVRIFWATPPTDAYLITMLENMGAIITGTEYMISHSYYPLADDIPVIESAAECCLDDPMIGTSYFRARRITEGAKRYHADGVIVSGISGASHCPFEDSAISRIVKQELDIPVLSFDVPYSPGHPSQQVVTRMEAFIEMIKDRKQAV